MTSGFLVGVGHCAVDYLGLLPRYPDRTESAEIAEFSQQGGGAASTALATLAIFGAKTRFVGKISDDHFGQFIQKGLQGLGVDVDQIIIEPGMVSPFTFSVVEMADSKPTVFWSRGNVSPMRLEEIQVDSLLNEASMLLVDGLHLDVQLEVAREAKARKVPVVLDAALVEERTTELISLTDTLIASERVATEIAPGSELEDILKHLQQLGPRRCVITLGSEGAIGIGDDGRIHEENAYHVEEIDITGAGDVYLGALTYAIMQEWPLPRAMRFASIAAGLTCRRLGSRAGIPKLSKVMELAGIDA